jgi:peptide deformylase
MILPIRAYGDPVLKKVAQDIEPGHEGLQELIADMFETMYAANGVGLAAPQVGRSIRLFVIDTHAGRDSDDPDAEQAPDDADDEPRLRKAFINPYIVEEEGEEWAFEEACLSIPGIREEVKRQPRLVLQYQDEDFNEHEETFEGFAARVIQHEHDHLDGILFVDHLPALRKTDARYKMRFPVQK